MARNPESHKPYFTSETGLRLCFLSLFGFISYLLVTLFYEYLPVFDIPQMASRDVELNDIYYRVRHTEKIQEHDQIVLVNTGSIPVSQLRDSLVPLLNTIKNAQPKLIGIDIYFEGDKHRPETAKKLYDKIVDCHAVLGVDKNQHDLFGKKFADTGQLGIINFPGLKTSSKRQYYQYSTLKANGEVLPSFARKLYDLSLLRDDNQYGFFSGADESFTIRYDCIGTGYYDYLHTVQSDTTRCNFPALEATDLMKKDSAALQIIRNKIVLLGFLGENRMVNPDQITDKHRVPFDTILTNRERTTPGLLIHAMALENLMKGNMFKPVSTAFWQFPILFVFLVLFDIIKCYCRLTEPFLATLVILLGTFVLIYFGSLVLMEKGYYFKFGGLLAAMIFLSVFIGFGHESHKWLGEKACIMRNKARFVNFFRRPFTVNKKNQNQI